MLRSRKPIIYRFLYHLRTAGSVSKSLRSVRKDFMPIYAQKHCRTSPPLCHSDEGRNLLLHEMLNQVQHDTFTVQHGSTFYIRLRLLKSTDTKNPTIIVSGTGVVLDAGVDVTIGKVLLQCVVRERIVLRRRPVIRTSAKCAQYAVYNRHVAIQIDSSRATPDRSE